MNEVEKLLEQMKKEPSPRMVLVTSFGYLLIQDEDTLELAKKMFEKFQRDFEQHNTSKVRK